MRRGSAALAVLVSAPLPLAGLVLEHNFATIAADTRVRDQQAFDAARVAGQRLSARLDEVGVARAEALTHAARQVGALGLAAAAAASLSPDATRWQAEAAKELTSALDAAVHQRSVLVGFEGAIARELDTSGVSGWTVEPSALRLPARPGRESCAELWQTDPVTGRVALQDVAAHAGPRAAGYLPGGAAAFAGALTAGVSTCAGALGTGLVQPPTVTPLTVRVGDGRGEAVVRIEVVADTPGGAVHRVRLRGGEPGAGGDPVLALVP